MVNSEIFRLPVNIALIDVLYVFIYFIFFCVYNATAGESTRFQGSPKDGKRHYPARHQFKIRRKIVYIVAVVN